MAALDWRPDPIPADPLAAQILLLQRSPLNAIDLAHLAEVLEHPRHADALVPRQDRLAPAGVLA